jgi:predicted NUDIX family NTP pyrophosphohydrolase
MIGGEGGAAAAAAAAATAAAAAAECIAQKVNWGENPGPTRNRNKSGSGWFRLRRENTKITRSRRPSLPNETQRNKLRGLSPRANYTDRATAACRRN